jgi:hypothetical protein
MNVNELLIQYLTTGDFPLSFRMQMFTPDDLIQKIKKCTVYLDINGTCDTDTAKELVSKL